MSYGCFLGAITDGMPVNTLGFVVSFVRGTNAEMARTHGRAEKIRTRMTERIVAPG